MKRIYAIPEWCVNCRRCEVACKAQHSPWPGNIVKAFSLAGDLRDKGIKVEIDHAGRGVKAQFKYADKIGAENVATIGDNELESGICRVKRMSDGTQTEVKIDELSTYFD